MLAENYPDEKLIISQQSLNNASLNINTGHWTIFRRTSEFCPTKSTGVYWMLMDMCLPMFDLYQGVVAPNCFKSHTNSSCLDFFPKIVLSDVRSEIHLAWRNIVSKNYIQACNGISFVMFRHMFYHFLFISSKFTSMMVWVPLKETIIIH